MAVSKQFIAIFVLCLVHQSFSKPANQDDLTEGRGIMSTVWGWITYPFSWWSSGESEQPVNEQLVGGTPNDNIQIGNHKVTIWCDDQTCTTMKCDGNKCRNITCSLYDTNLLGECREYNIIPDEAEEATVPKTTSSTTIIPVVSVSTEKDIKTPDVSSTVNVVNEKENIPAVEEHPLELEAVLSSTVNKEDTEKSVGNTEQGTVPEGKV